MTEREPVTNYEKKRTWRDGDPNGELDPDKGGSTGRTLRGSAYTSVSSKVDAVIREIEHAMPERSTRDKLRKSVAESHCAKLKQVLLTWIELDLERRRKR